MFPGPPLSADGSSASEGLEVLPLEDRKFWPRGLQWATAAQNLHLQNSCSEGMGPHLAGPLIPWNLWNSHRLAGRLGSHPMDHCLVWPSGLQAAQVLAPLLRVVYKPHLGSYLALICASKAHPL
jgi:hypothetical protein